MYVQPPPAGYQPPPPPSYYVPAKPPESRMGLFFGPRLGVIVPEGDSNLTNEVTAGFSVGGEVDLRFARRLFVGAVVEHGFLGTSSNLSNASLGGSGAPSFSTTNADFTFGVLTSPDHFGALFEVGAGYRVLTASASASVNSLGFSAPVSSSASSGEFLLGAGLWIPTGRYFRIVPRLDATVGSLSSSGGPSEGYAMITFNLAGYFNINFH